MSLPGPPQQTVVQFCVGPGCCKKFSMTEDVRQMSLQDMQTQLNELEDSYGEALKDDASPEVLNFIWERIKDLRLEIGRRKTDQALLC